MEKFLASCRGRKRLGDDNIDVVTPLKKRLLTSCDDQDDDQIVQSHNSQKAKEIVVPKRSKPWSIKGLLPAPRLKKTPLVDHFQAPAIGSYKVETLLSTPQSCLWAIRNYVTDVEIGRFSSIPLIKNPKFESYDQLCTAHRSMRFFNKDQLTSFVDDDNSELCLEEVAARGLLYDIMQRLILDLKFDFNTVLLNLYEDQNDYISMHSDKEVKPGDMVASIAFGEIRTLNISCKVTKNIVLRVPQKPGMLLVMTGNFQNEFKHGIDKEICLKGKRLSITFRKRRTHSKLATPYKIASVQKGAAKDS